MRKLLLLSVLFTTPAFADNTPLETALFQKLTAEANNGIQCSAANITAAGQIAALKARIKELEDKYEPKPAEPSK